MATAEQRLLRNTASKLSDVCDEISDLMEWAEDEGYLAIAHKLQEALSPLISAMNAADQYADGVLERRE